jgi:hypothetical protein
MDRTEALKDEHPRILLSRIITDIFRQTLNKNKYLIFS